MPLRSLTKDQRSPGTIRDWWRTSMIYQRLATVFLTVLGCWWLWAGLSTWNDLIGKPKDAPFLLIPGHVRSVAFWWIPGIIVLVTAFCCRTIVGIRRAFYVAAIGPMVRFVSYGVSFALSFDLFDAVMPDDLIEGDPRAYGSMWIYGVIVSGLAAATYTVSLVARLERVIVRLRVEASNRVVRGQSGGE